jgi:hypothetical protein
MVSPIRPRNSPRRGPLRGRHGATHGHLARNGSRNPHPGCVCGRQAIERGHQSVTTKGQLWGWPFFHRIFGPVRGLRNDGPVLRVPIYPCSFPLREAKAAFASFREAKAAFASSARSSSSSNVLLRSTALACRGGRSRRPALRAPPSHPSYAVSVSGQSRANAQAAEAGRTKRPAARYVPRLRIEVFAVEVIAVEAQKTRRRGLELFFLYGASPPFFLAGRWILPRSGES